MEGPKNTKLKNNVIIEVGESEENKWRRQNGRTLRCITSLPFETRWTKILPKSQNKQGDFFKLLFRKKIIFLIKTKLNEVECGSS